MRLEDFNALPWEEAVEKLLLCCHCTPWAERVARARPYSSLDAMKELADKVWQALPPENWRDVFTHHPRIGEKVLREKWAAQEQSSAKGASEATLQSLAKGNRDYEERFGHIFLICATGKTADEMLRAMQSRISNSSEDELKIAADEQMKITHIRLEKLFL